MGRQTPTGPPPLPAAQRLVIRYAKRGRMRFASHRDVARAVERGVRRAGLPVAYSAGFSPHPKISYSGGAPTGAASEAEYLEIALTAGLSPDVIADRLDAALPDGIDVIEVADLAETQAPRLEASWWQVVLPGVAPDCAALAVGTFLACQHAEVERLTSNGLRRLDARAGVVSLRVDRRASAVGQPECAILRMVVRHLTPAVRPDDILTALRQASGLEPSSPPLVTRLAQGPLETAEAGAAASAAAPPGPSRRNVRQGQLKAACMDAGNASTAHAAPMSAFEQLPRGAGRPVAADCAREPDGRDRPNARQRATEQRVS